jgi:hypothetical protein
MDYSDEYDSMAEEWEDNNYMKGPMAGGGGGGAKKKKKPTTVGKKREGVYKLGVLTKRSVPQGVR